MKAAIALAITGAILIVLAAGFTLLLARTLPARFYGDVNPESRLVQLGEGPVRYVAEGDASPEPLLLLHGYQGTLSQWNDTWASLQPCPTQRIRIDIPGFGKSIWSSRDFSVDAQADRIVAYLDAMGIQRVTLAGTSMGASIAASVAARHPDRVARLALFAPSGYPGSLTYDGLFGQLAKPGPINRAAMLITDTSLYRRIFPDNIATETLTVTASYNQRWADSLRQIRAPTLIVWSVGDPTSLPKAAPPVHEAIAGSSLLMLDAETGHSVPNSRPMLAAALLCELSAGTSPAHIVSDSIRPHLRAGDHFDAGTR